jgi:hypothetical protein
MAVNRTETAKRFLAKEIEKLSCNSSRLKCWSGWWWKEEAKMSKARLIKHREWLEREQVDQRQARLSPLAQVKVDTVRNWVKRQRASQRPNAREMFAALFVQPPTS